MNNSTKNGQKFSTDTPSENIKAYEKNAQHCIYQAIES